MQHRISRAVALLSLAFAAGACSDAPTAPQSAAPNAVSAARGTAGTFANVPVNQTVAGVFSFAGNLDVTRFAVQNGQLVALGTLTGTFTNLATGATTAVNQAVAAPVTVAQAACSILQLDIGAIHLDLLGLNVDLAPIHLAITAQPGPGNLLGNLLCAIAHLLDGAGNLNGLAALLNQLIALLG